MLRCNWMINEKGREDLGGNDDGTVGGEDCEEFERSVTAGAILILGGNSIFNSQQADPTT